MKNNNKPPRKAPKAATAGQPSKVTIRKLPTGVRGLDEILGGGIPEFSFNVIAGSPGCGKTTLLRLIAGFDCPQAGEIRLQGKTVVSDLSFIPPEKRGVGIGHHRGQTRGPRSDGISQGYGC